MKEIESELFNWKFHFAEAGLAKSEEMDELAEECQLFRAPTIIFNKNHLVATDKANQIAITFNAKEALRFINYEMRNKHFCPLEDKGAINTISYIPPKLYVKHAEHWKNL